MYSKWTKMVIKIFTFNSNVVHIFNRWCENTYLTLDQFGYGNSAVFELTVFTQWNDAAIYTNSFELFLFSKIYFHRGENVKLVSSWHMCTDLDMWTVSRSKLVQKINPWDERCKFLRKFNCYRNASQPEPEMNSRSHKIFPDVRSNLT